MKYAGRRESMTENIMDGGGSVASLCPTVCELMGLPRPRQCGAEPIRSIIEQAGDTHIEKCLVFCPDAIGRNIFNRRPELLKRVLRTASIQVATHAEFPSVTPVCFASMFTGAPPSVHGIQKYERPVVRIDSLFDAAIGAGRRSAIVAVNNSSMDLIFRERNMDYFSERYDPDVANTAASLVEGMHYDLIVAYVQAHDDNLHKTRAFSSAALGAVEDNIEEFEQIARACKKAWGTRRYAMIFAPDHGSHFDPEEKRGIHGTKCEEDMDIFHFYSLHL